ncbi:MAG TPA: aminopeptidase P family N-terminal domain-containing protein, partial [Gemmatimonadales bacterium]|nr:aminopeptidase P family N-terminal domain-containing protein [Gemmatimonadales bacterium]
MQRRDFMAAGAAAIADRRLRIADSSPPNPQSTIRNPQSAQEPSLSPEVFARRLDRARGELKARGLDLLIATPSTSYEYLTGYNPGRSERLIALLLPVVGAPAIVCPSFEVERIKRHSIVTELHGWEEQEDPHALVRETVRRLRPGSGAGGGTIALESSTAYQTFLRLGRALPGWKFVDAGPVTDRLRVIKSPEEVALLRRAIAITLDAMAATFAQLAVGTTEVQVA